MAKFLLINPANRFFCEHFSLRADNFTEDFYHPDVSAYLIRGSDYPLRFYDAAELWTTSSLFLSEARLDDSVLGSDI